MESISQNNLEGERLQLRAFKLSEVRIQFSHLEKELFFGNMVTLNDYHYQEIKR